MNVFLAVRGRRPDGFHDLVTVLQTVGIHDRVRVTAGRGLRARHPSEGRARIRFAHDGVAGVPDDHQNLCVRAATLMLGELGIEVVDDDAAPELGVRLDKDIPVAAGMAGGSADAAATLLAVNALLDGGRDRERVQALAAELGADVPFCVSGGTALATGTGTATAQVLCRGTFHWVIGMSDRPLATPDVYEAWDRETVPVTMHPDQVLQAVRTGDAELLGDSLHNDLQVAAFRLRPELADAVDAFLVDGALGAIVSGSGPTVVALAADAAHAHDLAAAAGERFDRVEVTTSPADGPALRRD